MVRKLEPWRERKKEGTQMDRRNGTWFWQVFKGPCKTKSWRCHVQVMFELQDLESMTSEEDQFQQKRSKLLRNEPVLNTSWDSTFSAFFHQCQTWTGTCWNRIHWNPLATLMNSLPFEWCSVALDPPVFQVLPGMKCLKCLLLKLVLELLRHNSMSLSAG